MGSNVQSPRATCCNSIPPLSTRIRAMPRCWRARPWTARAARRCRSPSPTCRKMQNHMREMLDKGLGRIADPPGPGNLPVIDASLRTQTPAPYAADLPAPDANVASELQQTAQAATAPANPAAPRRPVTVKPWPDHRSSGRQHGSAHDKTERRTKDIYVYKDSKSPSSVGRLVTSSNPPIRTELRPKGAVGNPAFTPSGIARCGRLGRRGILHRQLRAISSPRQRRDRQFERDRIARLPDLARSLRSISPESHFCPLLCASSRRSRMVKRTRLGAGRRRRIDFRSTLRLSRPSKRDRSRIR